MASHLENTSGNAPPLSSIQFVGVMTDDEHLKRLKFAYRESLRSYSLICQYLETLSIIWTPAKHADAYRAAIEARQTMESAKLAFERRRALFDRRERRPMEEAAHSSESSPSKEL